MIKITEKMLMNALKDNTTALAALADVLTGMANAEIAEGAPAIKVTVADVNEAVAARIEAMAKRTESSAASRKKRIAEASARLTDLLTSVLKDVHSPIDVTEISARLAELTDEEFSAGKITNVLSAMVKAGTVNKKVKRHEGVSRTHYFLAD